MLFTATLLLSAIGASPSADATPEAPTEAATEEKEGAKESRKICRRVTDGMGSRRKVRLCMTKEEWRDFNRGE